MSKTYYHWILVLSLIVLGSLVLTAPYKAAASWTENLRDSEIYSSDAGLFEDDDFDEDDEEDPNFLTEAIAGFFSAIGDGFRWLLNLADISLNSIILGRVGGNADVANFTFELQPGNPYGVVGASIYQVFRMICYAVLPVCVLGKLSFKSFKSMNAQQIDDMKSSLYNLVIAFLLLALMPYFLDLVLYIRDVILSLVISLGSEIIFGEMGSIDLMGLFRENTDTITGALVYIAAVGYSLYLAFLYVGYAMAFTVGFIVFPVMLIFSLFKPNLVQNWISSISYFIFIPVVDSCLLLIPVFFIDVGASTILTLFSCMCILSARTWFAHYLGLNTAIGGNMGFMFMFAAGKLVKTTVNTVKKVAAVAAMAFGGAAGGAEAGAAGGAEVGAAGGAEAGAAGGAEVGSFDAINGTDAGIGNSVSTGSGIGSGVRSSVKGKSGIVSDSPFAEDISGEGSGINILDRFRLYKGKTQDGNMNSVKPAIQAIGTAVGGALGAIVGGAATLMMGPAGAAIGADVGMSIGSSLGSGFGKLTGTALDSMSKIQGSLIYKQVNPHVHSQSEYASGEILSNNLPSVGGSATVSKDSNEERTRQVQQYVYQNHSLFSGTLTSLNSRYQDNIRELLEPIMLKVELMGEKKQDTINEDTKEPRELFRDYACQQYMHDFLSEAKTHTSYLPTSTTIEIETMSRLSNNVRNTIFDRNNPNSFVSDEALNQYDWFKL